jgi:hypothetical protein
VSDWLMSLTYGSAPAFGREEARCIAPPWNSFLKRVPRADALG